jgi:aspartyl-tRNA(Asn)/glutamyl-tRNA(Gln) amidotransferase subunit A
LHRNRDISTLEGRDRGGPARPITLADAMIAESMREVAAAVGAGRRTARELCDAAIVAIEAANPRLNAFLEITAEHARGQADAVDRAVAEGRPAGRLAGVPIAVKDNICTRFGRTTCASRMLAGYRSPFDATVIERLEAAGALVVGKTNLDEFAMGSSTENSAVGPTRNPWNHGRVAGGSSGGSAAAVAARLVAGALGSDTGGSVRQPAALCGVVGLKPTYGRVSRYGLVAFGSSLDQIGPLATSVADAALLLEVIAGQDPHDSTSAAEPAQGLVAAVDDAAVSARAAQLRIGVPREYFGEGLDIQVRDAVEAAIDVLRRQGARVVPVSLPHAAYCIAAYYLIATAEASSNLARFDGVHYGLRSARPQDIVDLYAASRSEGFGPEVKRRIMLGTFALSAGYHDAFYTRALRVRRLIRRDFDLALREADVLIGPVTPTPAFKLGEKTADPLQMYLADIYTISANLAGVPAISVPCGFSTEGLPIGLQLQGPVFGEATVLQAARLYERATQWHERTPPAAGG